MTPFSGCSTQRKMSAVIITEAAHGAMIAHRAKRLPGKRWLYSWARPSDMHHGDGDRRGHPDHRAHQDAGQVRVLEHLAEKLLSPADPIVMPSGVMFWNDVWTIVDDRPHHDDRDQGDRRADPQQRLQGGQPVPLRRPGRAAGRRPGGRARLRCSGRRSRLGRGDVRHQGLLGAAWDGRAAARDDTRAAASCSGRAQLPLLAVCWIAPRTCAGLPVMAWPTWVLICSRPRSSSPATGS